MLRSRNFVVVLVFAAVVGLFVSFASWGFLELVHQIQLAVFSDLPDALGFDTVPTWWPIPVLVLAGLPVAFAIVKLPGNGGHIPADGLHVGSTQPAEVPGVALAALATLGLGLVLGPEAPLIALGGGLAIFAVKLAKRDAPPQLLMVLAAAGSFAAISVIFGSPIVAAVLVIEASGLGGATLPLILHPGTDRGGRRLAGVHRHGELDRVEHRARTRSNPCSSRTSRTRPGSRSGGPSRSGFAGALLTFVIKRLGLAGAKVVPRQPWVLIPAAGLVVALLAILFAETTTHGANEVLFSGQEALPGLVDQAGAWSLGALGLAAGVQGVGVERLSRQLPWRPDVPGHLPRRRRRRRRVPPARAAARARGRGRDGRDGRGVPQAAAVVGDHRHVPDHQLGPGRGPADHHRRGGVVPRDAGARRPPRHRWVGAGARYRLTTTTTRPVRPVTSTLALSSA